MTLALTDNFGLSSAIPPPADDAVIQMWLHGRGPHTRRAYESDAARLRAFVSTPLSQITLAQLQAFADSLTGADASKHRTLCAVKSLFTFAHKLGYLPFDTARALQSKRLRNGVRPERILTETQVRAMISAEPKHATMLKVLYFTGIRVAELVSLKWADCIERESGGQITVTGKGNKVRTIGVPEPVWSELNARRGLPRELVYNFDPSWIWCIVRTAAVRVGITVGASTHWMRHSCASHALNNGAPLSLVQQQLGHASIATTSGYLHARPNESAGQYLKL